MDKVAEIRKLYYSATRATIQNDLARAIELLRSMQSEDERERAAVYMDGLSQMRSEWAVGTKAEGRRPKAQERRRRDQGRRPNESATDPRPNAAGGKRKGHRSGRRR